MANKHLIYSLFAHCARCLLIIDTVSEYRNSLSLDAQMFVFFCMTLVDNCNPAVITCLIADIFDDECSEDAADECSEFRAEVPLSKQFDSEAFKQYCE